MKENTIKIDFNSINEMRIKKSKANLNRVGISILVGISLTITIMVGLWSEIIWMHPLKVITGTLLIGVVCSALLSFILTRKLNQNFKKAIKEQVTKKTIEALGLDLSCVVNANLSKAEFKASKLIDLAYCRFKSEDFFTGKIDQIPYQFSEISIVPNYEGRLPFKGLYFRFDFSMNKELIIDAVEPRKGLLNKINSTSNFRNNTLSFKCLELEDIYSIFTNEIDSAKKLFSKEFSAALKTGMNQLGQPIYFTLRDGKLHFIIKDDTNYFNISFDKEIEHQIEQHCEEITFVHSFANELKNLFEPYLNELKN
jgi:hypothetical protein